MVWDGVTLFGDDSARFVPSRWVGVKIYAAVYQEMVLKVCLKPSVQFSNPSPSCVFESTNPLKLVGKTNTYQNKS